MHPSNAFCHIRALLQERFAWSSWLPPWGDSHSQISGCCGRRPAEGHSHPGGVLLPCSHRKKRMRQMKKMMQRGLLDPEKEDPFSLFVASTTIRYCFYHDTHKILGNTYGMAVLQARAAPSCCRKNTDIPCSPKTLCTGPKMVA